MLVYAKHFNTISPALNPTEVQGSRGFPSPSPLQMHLAEFAVE
ncbi:MAG TPA: hypothetical protein V6D43_06660 [Candidatus Sericytochromatia bacterium]